MATPHRINDFIGKVSHSSVHAWDKYCRAIVVDVETSMEGPDADPAPYGPKGATTLLWAYKAAARTETTMRFNTGLVAGDTMIVGHNLKFDWQHACKENSVRAMTHQRRRAAQVFWDTSIAEYVLTAQIAKFASLNSVAKKYLGKEKDDILQSYIDKGLRSQDIPRPDLAKYAIEDVVLTYEVAEKQWGHASEAQRVLIMILSTVSIVLAEAEYRGMRINTADAVARRDRELSKSSLVNDMMKEVMINHVINVGAAFPIDTVDRDRFNTPTAYSMMMFGSPSTIKLSAKLPRPIGSRKFQHTTGGARPEWWTLQPDLWGSKETKNPGIFTTDEAVLNRISTNAPSPHKELAKAILQGRAAHKAGTTYYQSLLEHQDCYGDGRIHHTINMTSTATGRTSSSNPNSQNQPEEVKEIFEPGDPNLVFCEFDFKQLEVWALARISQDKQLIQDLQDGADIHFETGKQAGLWKFPGEMTKDARRQVKSVNFGLIYGGAAKALAEQSGLDEVVVKNIIAAFYSRYPGVKAFHTAAIEDTKNARGCGEFMDWVKDEVIPSPTGTTLRRIMTCAPTGRLYAFEEKPTDWGTVGFSPTNIKNYGIQGFATADVVPLALVLLDLSGLDEDINIVAPVHDSSLQTTPRDSVKGLLGALERLPGEVVKALARLWGIGSPAPLAINVEVKERWGGKPTFEAVYSSG